MWAPSPSRLTPPSQAPLLLCLALPLPQLTCAGAQGTSGVGVLVPAPPLGAPGGGTLIPVRLCAAESLDAARGRSWGVGCEGDVTAALRTARHRPRRAAFWEL